MVTGLLEAPIRPNSGLDWPTGVTLLPSAIASAGIRMVSSRLQLVSAVLAMPGGCLLIPRRQVGVF